ncbi:MAG TPA: hypothetical protein VMU95_17295 [Trebonia sp.]|nr:hypothetical protein [Trebonia sp.]
MGLVAGDPYGWQDIGYTLSTLLGQLQNELDVGDVTGGSGLAGAWSGPAADAYQHDWDRRRGRYADLLANAAQATSAISAYGQHLADIVVQAGRLEATWLGAGLELAEDGFRLPFNFEALPHLWQQNLRTALLESERDVARIRADLLAAYQDLWTAIRDALTVLEDFQFVAVSGLYRLGRAYVKEEWGSWHALAQRALEYGEVREEQIAGHYEEVVTDARNLETEAGDDWQGFLSPETDQLQDLSDSASSAGDALMTAGAVIGVGVIGYQVWDEAKLQHKGWGTAAEDHAHDVASLAAGVAVTAAIVAAPVDVPALGVIAVSSVAAFGVGRGVQAVVNHRQAIGHALDEAASWGDEHALGWL